MLTRLEDKIFCFKLVHFVQIWFFLLLDFNSFWLSPYLLIGIFKMEYSLIDARIYDIFLARLR